MKTLIKWIETRQRQFENATTISRRDVEEHQIDKLKKTIDKLKKTTKEKQKARHDNWAKIAATSSTIAHASSQRLATQTSFERRLNKEMKMIVWIKSEKKMKRIQKMSATKMMTLTRESNANTTLSTRKNIQKIKRFKNMIVFKVSFESNKKILKFNDYWVKNVSTTTSLRIERARMMIHEVKVKEMSENIENERAKMLKKTCERMHSNLKIKKMKWLTRNDDTKKYAFMIVWIVCDEMTNRLIQYEITHESNIKTTQFYDKDCRVKQCLKCQKYDHLIYECKNEQRCVICAQTHRS